MLIFKFSKNWRLLIFWDFSVRNRSRRGIIKTTLKLSSTAAKINNKTTKYILIPNHFLNTKWALIRDKLLRNSKNAISIANREKAIKYGVKLIKKKGGILMVAGKGHENTQIIKNKMIKFSDQLMIKKYAKNIWENKIYKK